MRYTPSCTRYALAGFADKARSEVVDLTLAVEGEAAEAAAALVPRRKLA